MATLHPSNPYSAQNQLSRHLDRQSDAFQEPVEQPKRSATNLTPRRSVSETATPTSQWRSPNVVTYRTRSMGPFSAGVIFEREIDLSPPTDDEIVITTVRLTSSFRRASIEGCDELPSRPPRRGFLRRLSSRMAGERDGCKYTAMKMPRREYKKHFARDREGKYIGTEPEREWTREDLDREFGEYQDLPLRSVPGCSEYGEGDQYHDGRRRDSATAAPGESCEEVVVSSGGEVPGARRVDGVHLL